MGRFSSIRRSSVVIAPVSKADERSVLALGFTEIAIDDAKLKLAAQVSGVDNAREKIDEQGRFPPPCRSVSDARMPWTRPRPGGR